eukprot:g4064.t1
MAFKRYFIKSSSIIGKRNVVNISRYLSTSKGNGSTDPFSLREEEKEIDQTLLTDVVMNEDAVDHTIKKWYVKFGEKVTEGDPLCLVVTPEYSFDFIASSGGYLAEVLVGEDETCFQMEVMARLAKSKEDILKMVESGLLKSSANIQKGEKANVKEKVKKLFDALDANHDGIVTQLDLVKLAEKDELATGGGDEPSIILEKNEKDDDPSHSKSVCKLREAKQLLEEGLITEEDYQAVKDSVLGLKDEYKV